MCCHLKKVFFLENKPKICLFMVGTKKDPTPYQDNPFRSVSLLEVGHASVFTNDTDRGTK